MATTFAQTSFRHENKEVQREFERISKSPSKAVEKAAIGQNTPIPVTNAPESNTKQTYTVYHNGTTINNYGINRSINFIDNEADRTGWLQVEFDVSASNDGNIENAIIKAYYKQSEADGGLLYTEEFYTNKYFSNEPHARLSDLQPNYIKFGTIVYHDVKHNFNLTNKYKLLWSITYIGEPTYRCVPIVIPIDSNTIRVYASVRYGLSSEWQYLNTNLMSMPEEEMIAKDSVPKFHISVYSAKKQTISIINGGFPGTIDYISILNGGEPNTISYVSIVSGGTP